MSSLFSSFPCYFSPLVYHGPWAEAIELSSIYLPFILSSFSTQLAGSITSPFSFFLPPLSFQNKNIFHTCLCGTFSAWTTESDPFPPPTELLVGRTEEFGPRFLSISCMYCVVWFMITNEKKIKIKRIHGCGLRFYLFIWCVVSREWGVSQRAMIKPQTRGFVLYASPRVTPGPQLVEIISTNSPHIRCGKKKKKEGYDAPNASATP